MNLSSLYPPISTADISDTEPQNVPERATVEQITDEQAATVEAGRTAIPRVLYFLIEGVLKTLAEKRAASMTLEQKIAAGERHVAAAGLTGERLVTLMDILLQTKEANALARKPKLVALYTWLQTVKGMAIAGIVQFPPAPHTFEEVVSE
jgi:hypothetical protein